MFALGGVIALIVLLRGGRGAPGIVHAEPGTAAPSVAVAMLGTGAGAGTAATAPPVVAGGGVPLPLGTPGLGRTDCDCGGLAPPTLSAVVSLGRPVALDA